MSRRGADAEPIYIYLYLQNIYLYFSRAVGTIDPLLRRRFEPARPLRADARRAGPGDVVGERLGGARRDARLGRRGLRLDEGGGARLRLRGRGVDRRRPRRLICAVMSIRTPPVVHALPVARAVVAC